MCAAPDEGSSVPAADEGASVPLSGTEENTVSSDSDSDCNHVQQASWPSHWTLQQKQYFVTEYPWLYASDGKLGCTTCRDVSRTAGPQGYQGMSDSLAREQVDATIVGFGANKTDI